MATYDVRSLTNSKGDGSSLKKKAAWPFASERTLGSRESIGESS